MDLKDFKPTSDEITVMVVDPRDFKPFNNDDGTQMYIVLHAPHTKQYKSAVYKQAKSRSELSGEVDYEKLDEASLELLSNIIKSWDITIDGDKPEVTPEKAKEVLTEVFWLRTQLETGLGEFELFTKT